MRDAPRSAFPHFIEIATRWMDNDVYGHINNVNYYSFFDTAVNRFLIAMRMSCRRPQGTSSMSM
jgi:acyl-CoA thioester hydrolase